jgi:hypothetical protein
LGWVHQNQEGGFTFNRRWQNYNEFKEKGYPIGSGEIESAHKSIPQKWLKIPGASWHKDSIDPMLALRILRADDWWDDFWNDRTEKLLAA